MLKSELLGLINDVEETADIDEILKNTEIYKAGRSVDSFKELIKSDKDFMALMDSEKDTHHSKALETWKKNNLQKLIDAEILKNNPKKSPLELRLETLEKEYAAEKEARAKAEMIAKVKDTLVEKNIPLQATDWLITGDVETTQANITLFENVMKNYIDTNVNAEVEKRFKSGSHIPKVDKPGVITKEQFNKMDYQARIKIFNEDPELYKNLSE